MVIPLIVVCEVSFPSDSIGTRSKTVNRSADVVLLMRVSILILVLGAILFVLPVPGTFIAGGLVLLIGAIARFLGI